MAQRVITELIDDLDGTIAEETVTFGLDGAMYEIDLSSENAGAMRDYLAQFVGVARRAAGSTRKRSSGPSKSGDSFSAKARAWGVQNGYDVPSRGRVPVAVLEAYKEAQAEPASAQNGTPVEEANAKAPRKRASSKAAKVEPVE